MTCAPGIRNRIFLFLKLAYTEIPRIVRENFRLVVKVHDHALIALV